MPIEVFVNLKPTTTLFVMNFDPYNTRVRDLERHFEPYGKLLDVKIRRNFAFIRYELQEEATKALGSTHKRLVKLSHLKNVCISFVTLFA